MGAAGRRLCVATLHRINGAEETFQLEGSRSDREDILTNSGDSNTKSSSAVFNVLPSLTNRFAHGQVFGFRNLQ